MAYSDFTLPRLHREFHLEIVEEADLFGEIQAVEVDPVLRGLLKVQVPLAEGLSTEKARSELIVAPVLMDVLRRMGGQLGFFSGVEFDVDESRGLKGYCDYLFTRSPSVFMVLAPVLAIVEAKNENMKAGLGQCVAEMVAARVFNDREGEGPSVIYGAVTMGTHWRFLRLDGESVSLDRRGYEIGEIGAILAILLHCVGGGPRDAKVA